MVLRFLLLFLASRRNSPRLEAGPSQKSFVAVSVCVSVCLCVCVSVTLFSTNPKLTTTGSWLAGGHEPVSSKSSWAHAFGSLNFFGFSNEGTSYCHRPTQETRSKIGNAFRLEKRSKLGGDAEGSEIMRDRYWGMYQCVPPYDKKPMTRRVAGPQDRLSKFIPA